MITKGLFVKQLSLYPTLETLRGAFIYFLFPKFIQKKAQTMFI